MIRLEIEPQSPVLMASTLLSTIKLPV